MCIDMRDGFALSKFCDIPKSIANGTQVNLASTVHRTTGALPCSAFQLLIAVSHVRERDRVIHGKAPTEMI